PFSRAPHLERAAVPEPRRRGQLLFSRRLVHAVEQMREAHGAVAEPGVPDPGGILGARGGAQGDVERRLLPVRPAGAARGEEEGRGETGIAVAPGQARRVGLDAFIEEARKAAAALRLPLLAEHPGHGAVEESERTLRNDAGAVDLAEQ